MRPAYWFALMFGLLLALVAIAYVAEWRMPRKSVGGATSINNDSRFYEQTIEKAKRGDLVP